MRRRFGGCLRLGPRAGDGWLEAEKSNFDWTSHFPEGKVFQYFADKVKEHSGGKLEVIVYPNEQLGKTDAVLEQLKLGTVHLYAEGSTYMKKWVPEINWTSAAFMFDDRDHWIRFMETDLVQGWYNKASEEAGISLLGDARPSFVVPIGSW